MFLPEAEHGVEDQQGRDDREIAQSLTAKAIIAAASIIQGIGPQKKPPSAADWLFFCSSSAFGPSCESL